MLLWQRIAWHRRYTFLSKLLLVSACAHMVALFAILFVYKGDNFRQTITFDMHDTTIMFLPFQKTATPMQRKQQVSSSRTQQSAKKASSMANKKQEPLKPKKPATAMASASQKKEKKVNKQQPVKNEKPVVAKKTQEQKQEKKKPTESQATESKKLDLTNNDAVYVGQNDMHARALREEIRYEIEQAWQPPVGLGADKPCRVRVVVDWQGNIAELEFEESSQVVAFDASVRHALLTMKFPKSSYGKELILPFCSEGHA